MNCILIGKIPSHKWQGILSLCNIMLDQSGESWHGVSIRVNGLRLAPEIPYSMVMQVPGPGQSKRKLKNSRWQHCPLQWYGMVGMV